jgi:hypothetical protein
VEEEEEVEAIEFEDSHARKSSVRSALGLLAKSR